MSRRSILWADDEKALLARYEDELVAQGFDVDFVDDLDKAVTDLRQRHFDLVIWDMAMSHGTVFEREGARDGGMTVGTLFKGLVKKEHPETKTLLFTNFRTLVPELNKPDRGEYALAKRDYSPRRFAEMVRRLVD